MSCHCLLDAVIFFEGLAAITRRNYRYGDPDYRAMGVQGLLLRIRWRGTQSQMTLQEIEDGVDTLFGKKRE